MNTKTNLTADSIFQHYKDVITVPELAKMLRIGRNTAYELVILSTDKAVDKIK